MRKVEKIDVSGIPFTTVERNPEQMSALDGEYGACSPIKSIIYLNGNMPEETREQTLVHEWIHGVLQLMGIDHSEAVASVLSSELYRLGFRAPRWKCPPKRAKNRVAAKHISRKRK